MLLGLPDSDDIERAFANSAVMTQFAELSRAAAAHDQGMRTVIGVRQLVDVTVKPRDQ